jgi:cytochrome c peroxidase
MDVRVVIHCYDCSAKGILLHFDQPSSRSQRCCCDECSVLKFRGPPKPETLVGHDWSESPHSNGVSQRHILSPVVELSLWIQECQ